MARIAIAVVTTLVSYALGCINGAYYLHRLRTGTDIRLAGTRNAGARNAGRILGWQAFASVFLVDAGKGAIAVLIARVAGLDEIAIFAALLAVVLGHVFPAQLGFRGGKGIATTLGALMVADPVLALAGCAAAAIFLLVLRRPALSGAVAVVVLPLLALALERPEVTMVAMCLLTAIIVLAFRADLQFLVEDRLREKG